MLICAPANAATYVITYTGTMTGKDKAGAFGTAGADLVDQAFTAVFTLVYPASGAMGYTDAEQEYLYGGAGAYGVPSPLSAIFTANSASFSLSGTYYGGAQIIDGLNLNGGSSYNFDFVAHGVADKSSNYLTSLDLGVQNSSSNIISSKNLAQSFSYTAQPTDYRYSKFSRGEIDSRGYFIGDSFELKVATITSVEASSAVPEPATWAMLFLGFGAIGVGMRRRKQSVAGSRSGSAVPR
jgi:hypothetical protein